MARLIVELTNRCNLQCGHCYDERHAATAELAPSIIDAVLEQARACGIDELCFSGGEPTLYSRFDDLLDRASHAGYTFGFVSNGSTFRTTHRRLLQHRTSFRGVTFSLDGTRETTHDGLRGRGSYRQVMRAVTLCVIHRLPFTINMVITAHNRDEIEDMVALATRLGSRAIRFGHLMFSPEASTAGLDLLPHERRDAEARVWAARKSAAIPVVFAPGYFHDSPYFPCAPLEREEFNLDVRGNLTLCCHLSGHGGTNGGDVIANLHAVGLREALRCFDARVDAYLADKRACVEQGRFGDLDHIPCWYCANYVGRATPAALARTLNVYVDRSRAASRP